MIISRVSQSYLSSVFSTNLWIIEGWCAVCRKDGWRAAFFYCPWAHECMFHIWRLQSSEMKQSTFSLSTSFSYCATRDRSTFMKWGFFQLFSHWIWFQHSWLMGNNPQSFHGSMTFVFWGSLLYICVYLGKSFNCVVL